MIPTKKLSADRIAPQQPKWHAHPDKQQVIKELRDAVGVISPGSLKSLATDLASAASGEATVLQIGDCAEDPRHSTASEVTAKADFYHQAASALATTHTVVIGRIAGQFAKPRSSEVEIVDGEILPSFRGTLVNAPEPTPRSREHDPRRMADGHLLSRTIAKHLREHHSATGHLTWTSHEALVLDYESALIRTDAAGRDYLSSTHIPWIGVRTNSPSGPHAQLLARLSNPVGVKVGPSDSPGKLVELLSCIDPNRLPGRVTLIIRAGIAYDLISPLMTAVHHAGHQPVWLCDPMHGNTETISNGRKIRRIGAILSELDRFARSCRDACVQAAGLHLEATDQPVSECVDLAPAVRKGTLYTSLCDPRLNPEQTLEVIEYWRNLQEAF